MNKFHINPKTGSVNQCRAEKDGCPFGGSDDHFATREAAAAEIERRLTSLSMPAAVSKKSSTSEGNAVKAEALKLREQLDEARKTYAAKRATLKTQQAAHKKLLKAREAIASVEGLEIATEDRKKLSEIVSLSAAAMNKTEAEVEKHRKEINKLAKTLETVRKILKPTPTKITEDAHSLAATAGVSSCGETAAPKMKC